jgi:hypothetical protein
MAKKEITIKALNPKSSDTKYIGNEPTWHIQPTEENRISKLVTAFQWYNYHYGRKDAKEMIAHYLEIHDRSRDAKLIRGIPDSSIQVTIAWVCRMNLVGLQLTEHEQVLLEEEIGKLIKIKQEVKKIVSDVEVAQQKLTIQDHLREKVSECAGELEGMFDDFIIAGAKMSADFKPISVIRGMNIAPQLVNNIIKVWQLRLEEYNEVLAGEDEQLIEAYSHLSKLQLKNCVKFCETVINDCASYVQLKKVERKPRAKKAVSPEKLAAKFKYLKEFAELNLKSELPSKLVSASEAWLYDTAKRKIIHVMADSHVGTFTVKGSSVIAFDAVTTVQKTLRKPEEQIKSIISVGKPAARKAFSEIKSTEVKWNGRSNENLLILKAW